MEDVMIDSVNAMKAGFTLIYIIKLFPTVD